MTPRVLIGIVTYNSGPFLRGCLEGLRRQTCPGLTIRLWDNASCDDTPEIAAEYAVLLHSAHFSTSNIGFCAAHNRLIAAGEEDYVLALNPDVVLEPRFVEVMVRALEQNPAAGSASGKLWRLQRRGFGGTEAADNLQPWGIEDPGDKERRIIDTTGIFMTPNQRHFDRGSGEPDLGQYERREYVFGASGAAAFYRRRMLESVRAGDEYFDEAFFAYREDADLAWRAQWLGWPCLYVPEARGWHARLVLPERRRRLPADINMHSFKNRFLMRVKNMDAGTYWRYFLPITARDLAALAYVLVRERSSLRALPLLARALPRALSVRRALRRHRRTTPRELRAWFGWRPVSRPAG